MNLLEYVKMSYLRPNRAVLKGLGANDKLIEYLMKTPENTNIAIVKQLIAENEVDPEPEPESKSMTSIEVTHLPTKTNYAVGDQLDLTGMVVTAYFDDGSSEILTENIQSYPVDGATLTSSNTVVRVYYFELEDYITLAIDRTIKLNVNGATTQAGYYGKYNDDVANGYIDPNNYVINYWYNSNNIVLLGSEYFAYGPDYLEVIVPPANKYFNGYTTLRDDVSTLEKNVFIPLKNGDKEYYLLWGDNEMQSVTITIDMNGGKNWSQDTVIYTGYAAPVGCIFNEQLFEQAENGLNKQGYVFAGLTTVKDDPTTKITSITVNDDITLYALWEVAE